MKHESKERIQSGPTSRSHRVRLFERTLFKFVQRQISGGCPTIVIGPRAIVDRPRTISKYADRRRSLIDSKSEGTNDVYH